MTFEIKNTKTDKHTFVNIIVYGDSGVGKTSLVKTLDSKKTLVLSAEDGLLSIRDHGVDYVELKSIKDVIEVLNQVGESKYDTVVLDSITELSQNHFTLLKNKYEIIAKQNNKDSSAYGIKIWGDFLEDFAIMFKKLRHLKKNTVALGLVVDKEEAGLIIKRPDISGKTSKRIVAWFDECFYMYVDKEGNRKLLTEKTNNVTAKDRSGNLEKIEEPNLSTILAKILK